MISAQNIIYSDPNTFYTISEIKYYDLSRSKQKIVIRIVRNTDNDIRTLVIFNPQNTIDTLSLPSSDDFKNFSVTLKNTKNGFELKTIWGGGKNIYYDTFLFKYFKRTFYLTNIIHSEDILNTNKTIHKVSNRKIIPALRLDKVKIEKYLE